MSPTAPTSEVPSRGVQRSRFATVLLYAGIALGLASIPIDLLSPTERYDTWFAAVIADHDVFLLSGRGRVIVEVKSPGPRSDRRGSLLPLVVRSHRTLPFSKPAAPVPGRGPLPLSFVVGAPAALVPLMLGLPVLAVAGARGWRSARRVRRGCCRQCSYDVASGESAQCPECGWPVSARPRYFRRGEVALLLAMILGVLLVPRPWSDWMLEQTVGSWQLLDPPTTCEGRLRLAELLAIDAREFRDGVEATSAFNAFARVFRDENCGRLKEDARRGTDEMDLLLMRIHRDLRKYARPRRK